MRKNITGQRQFLLNKHCEILVSCSDKESDCMQAHGTSCKLRELHASLCNCVQAYVTACKLMYLHASSWICIHSGTFWNILHAFWNILEHSFQLVHRQTDTQTLGLVELHLRS